MVSCWDKTSDNLCPDCGTEETAAHLMVCPGHSRTLLLKQEVEDLERWMRNNNTDSAIAFWIPKCILLRNTRALSYFPNLPDKLKLFAAEQYAIGWREFTEERISGALIEVQRSHMNATGGRVTLRRRTKTFITKLLHITQSQWIHRNSSLHQHENGYLDKQLKKKSTKDVV